VGIWFQKEFPWVGPGFIHAVADDAADDFAERLRGFGFTVAILNSPAGSNFAAELYLAFGIVEHVPDRLSWDAFHDDFGDLVVPSLFAIFWKNADEFAARETKIFAEACAIFEEEFGGLGRDHQAVLVLTGTQPSFGSPERPVRSR
jgi:hypothetical protein